MITPLSSARRLLLSIALAVAAAVLGLPFSLNPQIAAAATPKCSWAPFTSTSPIRYRIPSVVRTAGGRLFAFAERRNNNVDNDDEGDFDISMATSDDDGCTWTRPRIVASQGSSRVSNPVPVYVPAVDKVLLISSIKLKDRSAASGYRQYLHRQWISADGRQVTALADGRITATNKWPGMTGTGHGLVLTTGSHIGRIVIALGGTRSDGTRIPRSLLSDDNGHTWRVGWEKASPGKLKLIEGTVAELTDGSLLASYRDNGKGVPTPGKNRVSATSSDGGESLGTSFSAMSAVKTVPAGGSLLQLTGRSNLLLFSGPSNTSGTLTQRKGMRIFLSTDRGRSWKKGLAVGSSTAPAYYSDLVQLNDSTVGILYESGYGSGKKYWHKIAFRQVSISALQQSLLPTLAKKQSPSIAGSLAVGRTVTAKPGRWSPSATTTAYQWLRSGKTIPGATSATYKVSKADKGKKLSVRVTATRSGYQKATATSPSRKVS